MAKNYIYGDGMMPNTERKALVKRLETDLRESLDSLEVGQVQTAARLAEAIETIIAKGITITDIAYLCDVSNRTVQEWPRTGKITTENAAKIASLSGLSSGYLMFGERLGEEIEKRSPLRLVDSEPGAEHEITIQTPVFEFHELEQLANHNYTRDINRKDKVIDVFRFTELTEAWALDKTARASMIWTMFDDGNEPVPGAPEFSLQVTTDHHDPVVQSGDMLGVSTDIWPRRGDFCMFLVNSGTGDTRTWNFEAGFYFNDHGTDWSSNWDLLTDKEIRKNESRYFHLRVRRDTDSLDDYKVHYDRSDIIYLGTAVCMRRWFDPGHIAAFSQLSKRVRARTMSRRRE